jgi:hypothetical protein
MRYMNVVKEKCEELDHHPDWTICIHTKTLTVNLTSHFLGNKVSNKDWELAAFMSQFYDNRNTYDRVTLSYMRWLVGLSVLLGSYWLFKFYERVKLHHRFTSDDFIFQRVDTKRNDYYSRIKP